MLSSRKQKWILLGLVLSLCVNLFLVGGIFGGHFRAPWGKGDRLPGIIMMTVPDDLKDVVREQFKKSDPDAIAARETLKAEMQAKRQRVADALAAEPFDRARLEAVLSEIEKTVGEMRSRGHRVVAEIAAGLTPEQRRRWAEGWREMKSRH